MTIETKFNLGDFLWGIDEYKDRDGITQYEVVSGVITAISISASNYYNNEFYFLQDKNKPYVNEWGQNAYRTYCVHSPFITKEEAEEEFRKITNKQ